MKRIVALLLILSLALSCAFAEDDRIRPQWPVPEYVNQLLAIADEEVGYKEGAHGYSKYGEYWGDSYAQWCAEFLCWCVDQVDKQHGTALLKNVYPLYSGQNTGMRWFIREGRWVSRNGNLEDWGYQWFKGEDHFITAGEYVPQPGDWVFFSWTSDGKNKDGSITMHCIEGNNPSSVARVTYSNNDKKILGFGTVHDVADWTMRLGNSGKKVTELQEKLIYLGWLAEGENDGHYGATTQDAITRFQTANGLKVLGIANIDTQTLITHQYEEKKYTDPDAWGVIEEDDDFFE